MSACVWPGCVSPGKPAVWCPVVVFVHVDPPVRLRVNLRFCDDCKELVTFREVMPPADLHRLLCDWPPAIPRPQAGRTRLDFDLVELDENPEDETWVWGFDGMMP